LLGHIQKQIPHWAPTYASGHGRYGLKNQQIRHLHDLNPMDDVRDQDSAQTQENNKLELYFAFPSNPGYLGVGGFTLPTPKMIVLLGG